MTKDSIYFQDYMPGNVCFGCGIDNPDGLHIKSYWDGDESVCHWKSQPHHHGWPGLMNGGIISSIIDCHCMSTAMAHAYKVEDRVLGSAPHYKYATGTMTVKYIKPTSNLDPITLRAKVTEVKGKKTVVACQVYSKDMLTVEAEVIAIRVVDTSKDQSGSVFK